MTLTRSTGLARGAGLKRTRVAGRPRRPDLDVPEETRTLLRWRSRGRCEAAVYAAGCAQDATDVHHRKRRRDGGHAIANLLDLCRPCHSWAHSHPDEARALGVIVSAYDDPAEAPVLLLSRLTGERRPAILTPDGGYLL